VRENAEYGIVPDLDDHADQTDLHTSESAVRRHLKMLIVLDVLDKLEDIVESAVSILLRCMVCDSRVKEIVYFCTVCLQWPMHNTFKCRYATST